MKGKSQMDWGQWEGDTGTDRQTLWGGGDRHHLGFWGPGPGGHGGIVRASRAHPWPSSGVSLPKMVFFQPKLRPARGGAAPTSPSALRGPRCFFWGAESSKAGGVTELGTPLKPQTCSRAPRPPQPHRALGEEKKWQNDSSREKNPQEPLPQIPAPSPALLQGGGAGKNKP